MSDFINYREFTREKTFDFFKASDNKDLLDDVMLDLRKNHPRVEEKVFKNLINFFLDITHTDYYNERDKGHTGVWLHQQNLQRNVHHLTRPVLRTLRDKGLLEVTRKFRIGRNAYGYKLNKELVSCKGIKQYKNIYRKKWSLYKQESLSDKDKILRHKVLRTQYELLIDKVKLKKELEKLPEETRKQQKSVVFKIQHKNSWFNFDSNQQRIFYSLQNLKKEIRECFYFYDKKTKTKIFPTSIDIKNSQLQSLSIKLLEGIEDKLPSTEEFIEKCKEGVIYDYFLEMIINHEPSLWGSGSLSRKDVKKEMLRYLYKNPKQNKRGLLKELDELMESYYPQVYEVITEYKNTNHKGHRNHGGTALAQLLQKDEAEVIKELQMDYPCLTIHDEILLYTPDVNTPKEIEERLKNKGYSQIEVEIGKIEEVKEEDILLLDLSRKSKTNDNKENLVTLNGILLLSIKMGQYFIDFSPPF
jgi:hypothetical protein